MNRILASKFSVILSFEKYKKCLSNNTCIVKGNRINRNFFDKFSPDAIMTSIECAKLWEREIK